jgi:hypothetical protein
LCSFVTINFKKDNHKQKKETPVLRQSMALGVATLQQWKRTLQTNPETPDRETSYTVRNTGLNTTASNYANRFPARTYLYL